MLSEVLPEKYLGDTEEDIDNHNRNIENPKACKAQALAFCI
jgi:hypothetical protein